MFNQRRSGATTVDSLSDLPFGQSANPALPSARFLANRLLGDAPVSSNVQPSVHGTPRGGPGSGFIERAFAIKDVSQLIAATATQPPATDPTGE